MDDSLAIRLPGLVDNVVCHYDGILLIQQKVTKTLFIASQSSLHCADLRLAHVSIVSMGVCSIRQFLVVIYLSSFMIARSLCRIRPPGIALPRQFHRSLRAVSSTAGTPSTIARAQQLEYGQQSIEIAGRTIAKGGLVAFPTETVYGLGANALMEKSVQAIFTAKLRPNSDPLIVHIADTSMMDILFDFEASTEGAAAKRVCMTLAQAFWPGPLTIVCKASQRVPAVVCAGTGYVGVRCPSHSIALSLLRASGVPIAAPSAVSVALIIVIMQVN